MKSPVKILTSAAVAGALVAGGIAGAAPAFASTDQTVAGIVNVQTTVVQTTALTSVPFAVSSNAASPGYGGSLDAIVVAGGATYSDAYAADLDAAGNGSVDIIKVIADAAHVTSVPAGTYQVAFTSAQKSFYSADDTIYYTVTPAQSQIVSVTVGKVATTITGWKTKSKSTRYGHNLKISSPTIHGLGPSAKLIVQYKKKGAKSWKTEESTTTSAYQGVDLKLTTYKFNSFHVHGKLKKARGTYYVRVVVKSSAFVTGATTKSVKVSWK